MFQLPVPRHEPSRRPYVCDLGPLSSRHQRRRSRQDSAQHACFTADHAQYQSVASGRRLTPLKCVLGYVPSGSKGEFRYPARLTAQGYSGKLAYHGKTTVQFRGLQYHAEFDLQDRHVGGCVIGLEHVFDRFTCFSNVHRWLGGVICIAPHECQD